MGKISNIKEGRNIVRTSDREVIYCPNNSNNIDWGELKDKYLNLKDKFKK